MPQYELNIRDYWQIIQKRRWVFITVFLVIFIFSIIYTNMQTPIYQATSAVQWVERRTMGSLLTDLVVETRGDPLVTQARIITSLPILEKVVVGLGLVREGATQTEIAQEARALQGSVSANTVTDTSIIHINVTHTNPQMAANIANKIAQVYIVENLKDKSKESRSVREFIEKQLEEVDAELKNSEEALAGFKEVEAPSGTALLLQNTLTDLELKRQEFLKQYTPMHPNVIEIGEQIGRLKEQVQALPKKELEYVRLERGVEINARLYRELQGRLAGARISEAEKVEDVNLVEYAVPSGSPIKPNKPLNYFGGLVMGLVLAMAGIFLVEQLDTSIGTIEDVETLLKLPTLGVIPYLRTKDEEGKSFIQRLFPKEYKGKEKAMRMRNQLLIHYSSSSPIFEAYRTLRTNIQTEVFKERIQRKILLFSSSGPEEGKSITISNLSIAMAQGGLRTLLIDADMRRAVIHHVFGMKNEPGLSNVLRGTIDSKDAIRTFTDILTSEIGFDEALKIPGLDNLNILVSGSLPVTPAELLASPEMEILLEKLRDKYDIILIDAPPVLAVADPIIIALKTDGVILVYRVGKTARSMISRAKTQFIEAGAQVRGVILNNISPEIELRYGYYYNYKYYGKYYGEKKPKT